MARARKTKKKRKQVAALTHDEAKRPNLPPAELEAVMADDVRSPIQVAYARRNRDLDPQLVWRGKDAQDQADLLVQAPPLFIQEKVQPKVLIDDLLRRSRQSEEQAAEGVQIDLFADFDGLDDSDAKTEFYQHDANWVNRMILGDSLQVMASLAEREGLRGKVQCIYLDPPYGIKFNSNFQWSTTSRDVRDGKADHITREPEQVKAFRDTWRDGIHSYLSYLRDRLEVARDLLAESGSIFVQIGEENLHHVRELLDEIFGAANHVGTITFVKTSSATSTFVPSTFDYLTWYGKDRDATKFRGLMRPKSHQTQGAGEYAYYLDNTSRVVRLSQEEKFDRSKADRSLRIDNLTSQSGGKTTRFRYEYRGGSYVPGSGGWKTNAAGMKALDQAGRLHVRSTSLNYVRFLADFPALPLNNVWDDTAIAGWSEDKRYVVQTARRVIERCVLMTSDPGDLVLDPTCGSGTAAYVAEQWGRRWITIDTSRVALALARARIMGARYPYYLLADSKDGQQKEAEVTRSIPSDAVPSEDVRQGFVYERVPHIMLKDIANNAEIDVIWETYQEALEPLREQLNAALGESWEAWEIPREADDAWKAEAKQLHADWWEQHIARQQEIDASITAKADFEYLYDKPYENNRKVRVAGPFTVESLSPHRVLGVDENDELIDSVAEHRASYGEVQDFASMILDNLKTAGVQQAHKEDRITFTSLSRWPGQYVSAEGHYLEGAPPDEDDDIDDRPTKRAAIFVGPEFGTVARPDLVAAAREAADANFDVLVACAFNYNAHASEFAKLGTVPVLKARMNADLHMAGELKQTSSANLFVIFGEPDIEILDADDGQIQVKVNGVDVFHPTTGEVRSDGPDGIACWFIDTDYNEESFFVRQAYFLGASDPYRSLKTSLKAEIDAEAWETLHSDTSRSFGKPASGRIAVKVINHLGDEVMKVFRVE